MQGEALDLAYLERWIESLGLPLEQDKAMKRRTFLARTGAALGGSRISMSDDSPGAIEAGVIYFIDAALADLQAESLEPVRRGLAELQARVQNTYGENSFAGLRRLPARIRNHRLIVFLRVAQGSRVRGQPARRLDGRRGRAFL
jgi:hypothetical protein